MKLTEAQRVMLTVTRDMGGTAKVFPDQWSTVSALEARGLLQGNGKYIDRTTTITESGLLELAARSSHER